MSEGIAAGYRIESCVFFSSGTLRQAQVRKWLWDLQRGVSKAGGSWYCSGIEMPTQLWICVIVYWKGGWPNTTAQASLNSVPEEK